MKKHFKIVLFVVLFACYCIPSWAQVPSTEGQDFWVTFLRADADDPTELKLTISAKDTCVVTIKQEGEADIVLGVGNNSSTEIGSNTTTAKDINGIERKLQQARCYSSDNTRLTNTALHVTSTKDISLFAGNYRNKSFDAANILPTSALLDDYKIQTYPASDHDDANKAQGSHFAIVAVEDNTIVDFNLTATAKVPGKDNTGNFVKLNRGQVCYVWTGPNTRDLLSDLSGSTLKARDAKKIAVFQGCPHTNIPDRVRNRDHIFSQAMPTAYWGTEFGITSSLLRRRDIIAVMALNDGTEVYRNAPDGGKILIHTFNFNSSDPQERKHYWTFEIGEEVAYCNGEESPFYGKLKSPLVNDSSCFITSSCPVGVHLIMASNRYDLPEQSTPEPDSDPALLWISPIEQVIKDINFATYNEGINTHYVNIITSTSDIDSVKLDNLYIKEKFHPVMGNQDYSFARVTIGEGSHNLHSHLGFCAHVYGYGEKASYAYSCGSSTVQRSITFNGTPLMIDSVAPGKFCVNEPIEMKLRIGNNNYQSVVWDFGDGISENGGSSITHTYNAPGWYDLNVSAEYINPCTNKKYNEDYSLTFHVWQAGTKIDSVKHKCIEPDSTLIKDDGTRVKLTAEEVEKLLLYGEQKIDTPLNCIDDTIISYLTYGIKTQLPMDTISGQDSVVYNDSTYRDNTTIVDTLTNDYNCEHFVPHFIKVKKCLAITMDKSAEKCIGENIVLSYKKTKGDIKNPVHLVIAGGILDTTFVMSKENTDDGELYIPTSRIKKPGYYHATLTIPDANDCVHDPFPIDVTIKYPEDIFDFKFTNVLAVRKDAGYNFRNYQWYINGKPVGGDVSVLYLGEGVALKNNDLVYVKLTDQSGMVLESCPKTIQYKEGQLQPNKAPARKVMQNQRIYILRDEQVYDIFGQKVK